MRPALAENRPAAISLSKSDTRQLILINHLVEPAAQITGITRYAFGLIEALLDRGTYRYALASAFTAEQLPAPIASRLERILTFPHVAATPLNYIRQRTVLREAVATTRASLVYAMNPMCPPASVPTVITAHDLYMKTLPHMYERRHRLWWSLFFGLATRGAAAVACVSRNTENDVRRFHPNAANKTRLVPGAGVMAHFSLQAPLPPNLQQPYVLLLGNLSPNKNAGMLLAALQQLRQRGQPVAAYHVGRDPDQVLAKAPDLIIPLGAVGDAELDATLTQARALVSCSSYEGFGLPLIEAQDRGTPVVATSIPAFREVAPEGTLFVDLEDISGLADAIGAVIGDEALRNRLSAAGRQNAARFSWPRSAEAAETVMAELLVTAARPAADAIQK